MSYYKLVVHLPVKSLSNSLGADAVLLHPSSFIYRTLHTWKTCVNATEAAQVVQK